MADEDVGVWPDLRDASRAEPRSRAIERLPAAWSQLNTLHARHGYHLPWTQEAGVPRRGLMKHPQPPHTRNETGSSLG